MARAGVFRTLGRSVLTPLRHAAGTFALLAYALREAGALSLGPVRQVFYRQVYFTGIQALRETSIIGLLIGVVVLTQIANLAGDDAALAGRVLVWAVVRELGPLFAAILVITRSSSAVAAELGTIRVNREMDHLRTMGVDPFRYLIVPRVLGLTVSLVALTVCFEAATILGGVLFSGIVMPAPLLTQLQTVAGALRAFDVSVSLAKGVLFGLLIAASACHHGVLVRSSITEVPQATTKAVMQSLFLTVLANVLVTVISFV